MTAHVIYAHVIYAHRVLNKKIHNRLFCKSRGPIAGGPGVPPWKFFEMLCVISCILGTFNGYFTQSTSSGLLPI